MARRTKLRSAARNAQLIIRAARIRAAALRAYRAVRSPLALRALYQRAASRCG